MTFPISDRLDRSFFRGAPFPNLATPLSSFGSRPHTVRPDRDSYGSNGRVTSTVPALHNLHFPPSLITLPLPHEPRISQDRNLREIILIAIIHWTVNYAHDERSELIFLFLCTTFRPHGTPGTDLVFENGNGVICVQHYLSFFRQMVIPRHEAYPRDMILPPGLPSP